MYLSTFYHSIFEFTCLHISRSYPSALQYSSSTCSFPRWSPASLSRPLSRLLPRRRQPPLLRSLTFLPRRNRTSGHERLEGLAPPPRQVKKKTVRKKTGWWQTIVCTQPQNNELWNVLTLTLTLVVGCAILPIASRSDSIQTVSSTAGTGIIQFGRFR